MKVLFLAAPFTFMVSCAIAVLIAISQPASTVLEPTSVLKKRTLESITVDQQHNVNIEWVHYDGSIITTMLPMDCIQFTVINIKYEQIQFIFDEAWLNSKIRTRKPESIDLDKLIARPRLDHAMLYVTQSTMNAMLGT